MAHIGSVTRRVPNYRGPRLPGSGGYRSDYEDTGPARDALNNLATRIAELDRHKRGGADRLQTAMGGARASAAQQVRRAGADPGSLAAMQIASGAETAALGQGIGREAEFQRGIDQDVIGGLAGLSGLEIGRQSSLEAADLARDRFGFDRERYEDAERLARQQAAHGQHDPLASLLDEYQMLRIRDLIAGMSGGRAPRAFQGYGGLTTFGGGGGGNPALDDFLSLLQGLQGGGGGGGGQRRRSGGGLRDIIAGRAPGGSRGVEIVN